MAFKYPYLASVFQDLLFDPVRFRENAVAQSFQFWYASERSYACANTVWKPSCISAKRPYYRLALFGSPPSTSVTVDLLGLLEYVLSRLQAVKGIDKILSRMKKEQYGTDNLHHDVALLESAVWFYQYSKAVEFEPRISSQRQPDFRLDLGGQRLFVEVKVQELGIEAERLSSAVGEPANYMPSAGGKIKQRLLEAFGVLNEKNKEFVDPQVPLDQPSLLILDLRFAAGLKDDVEALDAFLGQIQQSSTGRLNNGVIHHDRAKNVCGMLLIDQFTVLNLESGMALISNPLCRNKNLEHALDMIGVKEVT